MPGLSRPMPNTTTAHDRPCARIAVARRPPQDRHSTTTSASVEVRKRTRAARVPRRSQQGQEGSDKDEVRGGVRLMPQGNASCDAHGCRRHVQAACGRLRERLEETNESRAAVYTGLDLCLNRGDRLRRSTSSAPLLSMPERTPRVENSTSSDKATSITKRINKGIEDESDLLARDERRTLRQRR